MDEQKLRQIEDSTRGTSEGFNGGAFCWLSDVMDLVVEVRRLRDGGLAMLTEEDIEKIKKVVRGDVDEEILSLRDLCKEKDAQLAAARGRCDQLDHELARLRNHDGQTELHASKLAIRAGELKAKVTEMGIWWDDLKEKHDREKEESERLRKVVEANAQAAFDMGQKAMALQQEVDGLKKANNLLSKGMHDLEQENRTVKEDRDNAVGASNADRSEYSSLHKKIRRLEDEIVRLKAGKFTEQEFQDLCHVFNEGDCGRFCEGCLEYQVRLFGIERVRAWWARKVWAIKEDKVGVMERSSLKDNPSTVTTVANDPPKMVHCPVRQFDIGDEARACEGLGMPVFFPSGGFPLYPTVEQEVRPLCPTVEGEGPPLAEMSKKVLEERRQVVKEMDALGVDLEKE